ncbi:hypothetical protein [Rhizobium sp. LCM 4573]|uniref:hypothetical protein n=1 Tax=Rhizobium sp. LCM 4573 TaxID=1848291 RepID=UPI001041D3A0|nr:hypothetical protein [Rhizobium sp. LCM 4573]
MPSFPRNDLLRIGAFCLAAIMLSGCMTAKKPAEVASDADSSAAAATKQQGARGILAKGGETTANGYVDPYVRSAASLSQQAANVATESPVPENPAAATQPASLAELVTHPTGIRAGSVSIFSGQAPAAYAEPTDTASIPAGQPTQRISATTGSVFSAAPQNSSAADAPACGTDTQGQPLSC